jgi:protein subunit release factor B
MMDELQIPESDEELLAECEVQTFRASGPGGQNVNRRETAVRLRHRPSGATVVCQRERSQLRNKLIALEQLREKLERLTHRPKRRIPTVMSKAVRERILDEKKKQSEKKRERAKPDPED